MAGDIGKSGKGGRGEYGSGNIVFLKPGAYREPGESAARGYFEASQRVLSFIEKGLVKRGYDEIRALTGYSGDNPPDESPKKTPTITLDGIEIDLVTDVRALNPDYGEAFKDIGTLMRGLIFAWEKGYAADFYRTSGKKGNAMAVNWNYVMENAHKSISGVTELEVVNQIKGMRPPGDYGRMKLDRLAVPVEVMRDFDIRRPGTAKIVYLAKRFCEEIIKDTVGPFRQEMIRKTGITRKEMPEKTDEFPEQIGKDLFTVKSIPSPRKQYKKGIETVFKIPQKGKPKGSRELPVIPDDENYIELLEEYRDVLPSSLKKWKSLQGNIGEIVTFYYGIEGEERVREELGSLPEYLLERKGDSMFVSGHAIYKRLMEVGNVKTDRLLRKIESEHIV